MPMPEPPKDLVPAEVAVEFPTGDHPVREFFWYESDDDGTDDAYVQAVKWLNALQKGEYTIKILSWTEPKRG